MSSSSEVERRKRFDPFYEPPLHKAYYHPTLQKELSDEKRLTALSSDRMCLPPNADDIHFLKATNTYRGPPGTSPGDTSSKFDESWPVSEKPSTLDDALEDLERRKIDSCDVSPRMKPLSGLLERYAGRTQDRQSSQKKSYDFLSEIEKDEDSTIMTQTTSTTTDKPTGPSTLSKYIDRFRHAAPMSRGEREKMKSTPNQSDFWWLRNATSSGSSLSPKNSSTPKDESGSYGSKIRSRLHGPTVKDRDKSSASTTGTSRRSSLKKSEVSLDSDTQRLIDKTNMLLEKSESSLNSSDPVVSTVGLGSSTSSHSSTLQDSRDRSYMPSHLSAGGRMNYGGEDRSVRKPRKPEDDILYQWRAQRRVEAMRTKANLRLQNNPSPAALAVDVADSRIAEIKRRVTSGDHYRRNQTTEVAEAKPSYPPATPEPLPPTIDNKMVQSDAFCQTSLNEENEPGTKGDTRPSHDYHSPIASPSLPRKKTTPHRHGDETDVQSHYHLSCDIIPCPHDNHRHTSHATSQRSTSQPPHMEKHRSKSGKPRSYHSDTDTDESYPRRHDGHHAEEDDVPVRDIGPLVINSCTDSEYETLKERHLEEVRSQMSSDQEQGGRRVHAPSDKRHSTSEKRHPSSDIRHDERSRSHSGHRRKSSKEGRPEEVRDGIHERHAREKKKVDEDYSESKMSKHDAKKTHPKRSREDLEPKETSRSSLESLSQRSSESDLGPRHSDKSKVKLKRQSRSRERLEELPVSEKIPETEPIGKPAASKETLSGSKPADKPKPKWSGKAQPAMRGARGGGAELRVRVQDSVGRSSDDWFCRKSGDSYVDMSIQDSTPLCHSSPIGVKQRAVTPTIQKVITERLFEDTSEDDGDRLGPFTDDVHKDSGDDPVLSDGEEFPEDDLLRDLRARRLHYLHKLEVIDKLLEDPEQQQ